MYGFDVNFVGNKKIIIKIISIKLSSHIAESIIVEIEYYFGT